MSEPQLWITGPSGAWFMPQRKVTPPIRRGTARRLGITQPDPVVTVYINPDLSAFGCSLALLSIEARHRAIRDAFWFSYPLADAQPEETP